MKRIKHTSFICLLLILFIISATPEALATEVPVQPRYTVLTNLDASLTISAGKANCYGLAYLNNSSYTIQLSLDLQRTTMTGDPWTSYLSWTTSGTIDVSLYKSRFVTSGYFYRLIVTATVYDADGNLVEEQSISSDVVEY